jgi:hypothetical protein
MLTKNCNKIPQPTNIASAASLPVSKHVIILRDSAIVAFAVLQIQVLEREKKTDKQIYCRFTGTV